MKKVILYYDHFITLPSEIDRFWCTGSHTWASIVFLANRYVALLGHLPLFYVIFTPPCKAAVRLNCSIFQYFSFSLLLALVSLDIPTLLRPLGFLLICTEHRLWPRTMAYSYWS